MNATIQEGNVGRNFGPVDKLKVALQNDGGDSFWVLEESVALENLYTHTNGTYLSSSDNVYGWGEVIVDVDTSIGMSESEIDTSPFVIDPDTGDLIDIDPYKETDYFIIDPDTGDRIDVDPWQDEDEDWYIDDPFDPEGDPIPIQEDEDGDWYIEDPDTEEHIPVEDEDNWYIDDPFDPDGDPIIVEEDENGDPFIEYDDEEVPVEDWDEDEWEDDELDDDWDDEPDESWEDDDWDSDLDVDGISGIDPDTGLEVLIDVDENGNLIEAECPESIIIVTQPNIIEYADGDSLNITGMVVTAKKADGSTWTSTKYPNGHIPLQELIIEPATVDINEATQDEHTSPLIQSGVAASSFASFEQVYDSSGGEPKNPRSTKITALTVGALTDDGASYPANHKWMMIGASKNYGERVILYQHRYKNWDGGRWSEAYYNATMSYTYDGKTVYYYRVTENAYMALTSGAPNPRYDDGMVAWTLVYGDEAPGGEQEISVGWNSPCGVEPITTTFEAIVHEQEFTGHSGKF